MKQLGKVLSHAFLMFDERCLSRIAVFLWQTAVRLMCSEGCEYTSRPFVMGAREKCSAGWVRGWRCECGGGALVVVVIWSHVPQQAMLNVAS